MHTIVLTPWVTLQGNSSSDVVVQGEDEYKDLGGYEEVSFYLQVKDFSGTTLRVHYQTSPTKEDELFKDMATESVTSTTTSAGPTVTNVTLSSTIRLARWVRYQVDAAGAWRITMRIVMSCKPSAY